MPCGSFIVAGCRSRGSSLLVKFRAVSEADRLEIDKWIAADPGHKDVLTSKTFLIPIGQCSLYALEDEQGTVMYTRWEVEGPSLRVRIQFGPDRKRVISALREGFPQVREDAKKRGFKSITFDSKSPALVKLMMQEFGFVAALEAPL